MAAMALEREMATFNKMLPTLLAESEGRFALVVGDSLSGVYDSYADALQEGYKVAGLDQQFLVKKVTVLGDSALYSRPLVACQA